MLDVRNVRRSAHLLQPASQMISLDAQNGHLGNVRWLTWLKLVPLSHSFSSPAATVLFFTSDFLDAFLGFRMPYHSNPDFAP